MKKSSAWFKYSLLVISLCCSAASQAELNGPGNSPAVNPGNPPPFSRSDSDFQAAVPETQATQPFDFVDGIVYDASRRGRGIAYRLSCPLGTTSPAAVILISHGGDGHDNYSGILEFDHLRTEYASHGYVVFNLNHRTSRTRDQLQIDRPLDVSFIIDCLFNGSIRMPREFTGSLNLRQIGHIGHSWGAYTTMALAGGKFVTSTGALQRSLIDPRIAAHVALSPQGSGQFGSYDLSARNNTWSGIVKPMYNLIGSREKDGANCGLGSDFIAVNWRLAPFHRLPAIQDKFQSIVPGACHEDMGDNGPPIINDYIAQNSRVFFDVYLCGQTRKICDIGQMALLPHTAFSEKSVPGSPYALGHCATGP